MPDELHTVFRQSFGRVANVHSQTLGDRRYHYHCPMCSLALAFNTTLETIPNKVPYLKVPSAKSASWKKRIRRSSAPGIGLVWAGKPSHNNDSNRSIPASALLTLAASPGAVFYSLQRDLREGDADVVESYQISHLGCDFHDFGDAAAAIERLDLVITVDTSVAHLAGALGKPVWILLPFCADWRWMMQTDVSPWYPTARLFRQSEPGNWASVITRVASELDAYVSKFVS